MTITRIDPGKRLAAAVKHNDTLYIAGQTADTGPVVHYDRLAQPGRQLLSQYPCKQVGPATRWKGHDETEGVRGPGLRMGGSIGEQAHREQARKYEENFDRGPRKHGACMRSMPCCAWWGKGFHGCGPVPRSSNAVIALLRCPDGQCTHAITYCA